MTMNSDAPMAELPRGTAEFTYFSSDPSIDWSASLNVVKAHESEISRCFAQSIPDDPNLDWDEGTLELLLRIDPRGRVTQTRVHGIPESLEDYRRCFEDDARAWTFPAPTGDPAVIVATFELSVHHQSDREPRPKPAPHNRVYPTSYDDGWDEHSEHIRVLDYRDDVDACYDTFLKRRRAGGELELELIFDRNGHPSEISVTTPSLRFTPLARCVTKRMEGKRIEPSRHAERREAMTYDLRPDAPQHGRRRRRETG